MELPSCNWKKMQWPLEKKICCVAALLAIELMSLFVCFRFSDLEGNHRHTVYDGTLPHPFALTLFEDTVYWSDWNTRSVERGNKYDGSGRQPLVNTTHRPFDIHVYHPYRQPIGEWNLSSGRWKLSVDAASSQGVGCSSEQCGHSAALCQNPV